MQLVAGPHRTRPTQFVESDAKDSAGRPQLAVHDKPHSQRCGMPAARHQPTKDGPPCRLFIEVVGLWIELRGESDDLILVDPQPAGTVHLSSGPEDFHLRALPE